MKKKIFFLIFLMVLLISCNRRDYSSQIKFSTPIIKSVGKIDVIVNPNVELMMLIGRLTGAEPYNFTNKMGSVFINEVDVFFKDFKEEPVMLLTRKNCMDYNLLPEFGMYMNESNTGFIMDINNKNFIIEGKGVNAIQAKKIPYYGGNEYIYAVKDFRMKSNFDNFFLNHKKMYEEMINTTINILSQSEFDKWLESFYGIKIKEHICLHVTYFTGGGNFGIKIMDSKGNKKLNSVLSIGTNTDVFMYLLSHEFSHPLTIDISRKLYKNKEIRELFDNLFRVNSSLYVSQGYGTGFGILNETVNQACANKFLEKIVSPSIMERYKREEIEEQKKIYVPQIAEFLDNYEKNRKKYKTLDDFVPELEKFIEGL